MDFKKLYQKYKDVILYLFFGVCTTLVNVVVYWICAHPLNRGVMSSTIIAWILAVIFAYITNRKWVFQSEANGSKAIIKEIISFFACRLGTGVVDWACMYIFVDLLVWNDVIVKVVANIVVIILNYMASKLIIFRRRKQ
jgi:putative flippase GtrA